MSTKEFKTAETRIASGEVLAELGEIYPNLVVLTKKEKNNILIINLQKKL